MGAVKCAFPPCGRMVDKVVRVTYDDKEIFVCERCAKLIKKQKNHMIRYGRRK